MAKPHVLVVSHPLQGHVIPLMEFARHLAKEGVKVTFINTEPIHKAVTRNMVEKEGYEELIHMASISDGLEPWEDRQDYRKLFKSILETMPSKLEQFVEKINKEDSNIVTCIVADVYMGWAIRVAKKMGIRRAAYCPSAATTLAIITCAQKWIDDGVMSNDGIPLYDDMLQLSESMPPIKPTHLGWICGGGVAPPEVMFRYSKIAIEAAMSAERVICNSSIELEPAIFNDFPQLLPVGPLLASNDRYAKQTGHFWQEDSTCLSWLDQQPTCSVIYIAFGSITMFTQTQLEELAFGLELSNRPFMWVVRTNMTKAGSFPDGYVERVGTRGKIVSWAPQQKVLAHPSVAFFISHCGWNSSLEGVTNGLPFLCWPYITDQYFNETVICDIWKTGLGLKKDEQGIVTREEIKSKVERILTDKSLKEKAIEIKKRVTSSVQPGGISHQNLCNFIHWIQGKEAHANL